VHPNFAKIPECDRQQVIVRIAKNDNHAEAKLTNLFQKHPVKNLNS
jgi:hypothetical protein